MKIRTGFVSNSSSSSFVCEICNEIYSGWDACPSDFDMDQCEKGHVFCKVCNPNGTKEPTFEEKREFIKHCIEQKRWGFSEEDLEEDRVEDAYHEANNYYGIMSSSCPICNLQTVSKELVLDYLFKTTKNLTIESIENEIRGRFSNLQELKAFVKEE